MGCKVNIKLHYLKNHGDKFPQNLGSISEERFHQDIKTIEERYKDRWNSHMMVNYCWSSKMGCPRDFLRKKVFKIKVVWTVICIKTASNVLYFVLMKNCIVMTTQKGILLGSVCI